MAQDEARIAELREKFGQTPFSRAHDRLKFETPVIVEILIPEETFRPHGLKGYTLNISVQGMQVVLEKMDSRLYSQMLARQRMARVSLNHPRKGKVIGVLGSVAWIDYRKGKNSETAGDCSLGIAFSEKVDGVDLTEYAEIVEDAKLRLRRGPSGIRVLEL